MTPSTMRDFGVAKTRALLAVAVDAICRAAVSPEEEPVHKMRVAIRRFQQSMRVFRQYLDADGVKRVKANLRSVMDVAGELRNRDIAISLVEEAAGDASDLRAQRDTFNRELREVLQSYATPYLAEFWIRELGLEEEAAPA